MRRSLRWETLSALADGFRQSPAVRSHDDTRACGAFKRDDAKALALACRHTHDLVRIQKLIQFFIRCPTNVSGNSDHARGASDKGPVGLPVRPAKTRPKTCVVQSRRVTILKVRSFSGEAQCP